MSRLSMIAVLVGIGSLVVGLSGLMIDRGDSPVAMPVAAATPESAGCKPCVRPDGKPNTAPNVTEVALNKTEIRLPCPGTETAAPRESVAEVTVAAEDAEGDVLTYNYVISGGRIIGQGKNVHWDLTKVRAGTYSITAAVDDGCGLCGKTESKTLAVVECTSTE